MARSIIEIEKEITDNVSADAVLQTELTSTSTVSIWRLWANIVATAINGLEKLWDAFRAEVIDLLSRLKPHSLRWYAERFKAFQLGIPLLPDSDQYDNSGYTNQQIIDSKVVRFVAVTEEERPGLRTFLRAKLAGFNGTDLVQLPEPTLVAIRAYCKRFKDAGVKVVVESLPPDKITMKWKVFYDPTILAANGSRLDGTSSQPAKDAITGYLQQLPFNGLYVRALHVDHVQKVDGVVIPEIDECLATYGLLAFSNVNVEYQPDAGWLRFVDDNIDLQIQYIPHDAIES